MSDKISSHQRIQVVLLVLVLAVSITALVFAVLAFTQQRDGIQSLRDTTTVINDDLTHLQMANALLQSEVVEISMHTSNETTLQEGTFVWSVGGIRNRDPGETCSNLVVTGFAISAPGSGYRVGDLVTLHNQDSPISIQFYKLPVLKVTSVGLTGEVQSFDVLTPGCLAANPPTNNSISTISIVGTGLTVKRYAGPYPPIDPDTYYVFQTPQSGAAAPLQYANYSLRQVTIESVAYTVLYLYPPDFPVAANVFNGVSDTLNMVLYEFDPLITQLQSLGSYYYVFPLTQKNYNAISLVDDTNCLATSPDCWLDAYGGSSRDSPSAFQIRHFREGYDLQISNPFIQWHFTSTGYTHDYPASNAVLTLNYPFMLVLPSL